jgi:hypothetical protein
MYIRALFPGIPRSPVMGRVTRSILVKTLVDSKIPYHQPIFSSQISFTLFRSY